MTRRAQWPGTAVGSRRQTGSVLVWLLGLIVLFGSAVIGAVIAYLIFTYVEVRLPLRNQPAKVTILEPVIGHGKVLSRLSVRIDETIHTRVPVDQNITIPISGELDLMLHFDGNVPLKLSIPVNETIHLTQRVELDTVIEAKILGDIQKLHVSGIIPLDERIQLDITVPVNKSVHLNFTAPVTAFIDQKVTVPLETTIEADVPIDAAFNIPVLNKMVGRIEFPDTPTRVILEKAELVLPLRTLKLGLTDEGGNTGANATQASQ